MPGTVGRARQNARLGAEILTPQKGGMEAARDLAEKRVKEKKGIMLNSSHPDNPRRLTRTPGPR